MPISPTLALESTPAPVAPRTVPPPSSGPSPLLVGLIGLMLGALAAVVLIGLVAGFASLLTM